MQFPAFLAFTDADGWRPGMGDPTIMGWITVFAYLAVGVLAFRKARSERNTGRKKAFMFWIILGITLLALGINKQLDLQTWFTLTGKKIAQAQGWYGQRRIIQLLFIIALAGGGVGAFFLIRRLVADDGGEVKLPLVGFCVLLCFVVIRAASFHHVDQMLHVKIGGVKMNWVLELGGIGIVGIGAVQRRDGSATRQARLRPEPA